MSISRRTLITRGFAAAAGLSGLAVAGRIADRYGLIPPDHGGIYGPGETLTYGVQRLLTRHSLAREFSRGEISKSPFANETPPPRLIEPVLASTPSPVVSISMPAAHV